MIWALIIFVGTLVIDIWTDTSAWEKVRHTRGALLRLCGLIPAAVVDYRTLLLWITYSAIFDTSVGLIKHYRWPFIGSTSFLDRMQTRWPALVWGKYILGLSGLIIYIWLLN